MKFEKKRENFIFSNLFENEQLKVFEGESIISFDVYLGKLVCISDETIRIFS